MPPEPEVRPRLREAAPGAAYLRAAPAAELRRLVAGRGPEPFFCTHVGPSMAPLLVEGDLLEVLPSDGTGLVPGDVVLCVPFRAAVAVVHRVIEVAPLGIRTRGDNNGIDDPWLLAPSDVLGRVVAAWRGSRRRRIAGGAGGLLRSHLDRCRRFIDQVASHLLHPIYHATARSGVVRRLAPTLLQPRVALFQAGDQHQWRLLLGRRVVGHYDFRRHCWHIRRPFRLLVNESVLPTPAGVGKTASGPAGGVMNAQAT